MKSLRLLELAFCAPLALLATSPARAQQSLIVLASTTSVDNSGLLGHILPIFTTKTGIAVRVIAQGTGQALATASRGDADLVLVHDPDAEAKFMADGDGLTRREIAWNDFILVGPKSDPAKVSGKKDILEALRAVWNARAPFVSRGDKSGTDALEKRLWKADNLDPAQAGPWYKDIGGGMGAALNAAAAMDAYTLSDRGTWLSFNNRQNLMIVVQGDRRLLNYYDVIQLDPKKHPNIKRAQAKQLADWLASKEGQAAIAGYTVGGEKLFHPEADPKP
ncbi:MAG: substrate-binding domain-containing protein [Tepidisphaerales bacterium]